MHAQGTSTKDCEQTATYDYSRQSSLEWSSRGWVQFLAPCMQQFLLLMQDSPHLPQLPEPLPDLPQICRCHPCKRLLRLLSLNAIHTLGHLHLGVIAEKLHEAYCTRWGSCASEDCCDTAQLELQAD